MPVLTSVATPGFRPKQKSHLNDRTHISFDVVYERTHLLKNGTGRARPKKGEVEAGDFKALAAGSIAWQSANARATGPVSKNGDAFSAQWRVELVKTKSGAFERGFRIGKLGFGLVGSYLGYQAQNLLLSESGKEQRRAR